MKRSSGVLMHISTLWGDYSEGSFGKEAREWIDFLADCGFTYWQTLPFCLPDAFHSPYKSFSTFSGNPNFLDLPDLHKMGLITQEELNEARQVSPYACEFDRLEKERMLLLGKAAQRFSDWRSVDSFLAAHPGVDQFCRFMALRQANQGLPWNEWTVNDPDLNTLRTWRFIQYFFYRQWQQIKSYANNRGISIIGDIPMYVDWDSADVWNHPSQFLLKKDGRPSSVAGVPPDYFCREGQLWGNPLYNWEAMSADGFTFWKARISYMSELFDGIRIDHFRAFDACYSVAADAPDARNGKWMPGPGLSLIHALRQTSDRLLVAEDLGVITESVEKLVQDSGFPGMRVLQFAFGSEGDSPHMPHNYPSHCVAYTGTHDNNTLLGYVWEASPEERKRLFAYCGYDSEDIHHCYDSILRTMMESHAGLVIFPVQDLLLYGRDTRLNTPGKSEGNWAYRLTKDQLNHIDRDKFLRWNRMYGRF